MVVNKSYVSTEFPGEMEMSGSGQHQHSNEDEGSYRYEEALDLAGNGAYTVGLLAVLSVTVLAMGCDMFGFSVVVGAAYCDLQLTPSQRNLLMCMPFLGPMLMSYPWGYMSDTRGRRKCLLLAMSCASVTSLASAFSPHWAMMAVLKFISTSCCSCAQSLTYALLGESSPQRVRGSYMLVMTSLLMLTQTFTLAVGYLILNLEFSYTLGSIRLVPWRLLVLALALPLGVSALALRAFYESPKFLANAGRQEEAVEILAKIWRRNGGKDQYPVKKLILNADFKVHEEKRPLLRSLWEQTAPLFRAPLLWRTLQLFYLTMIVYSVSNSLIMWYPIIADTFFTEGTPANANLTGGLCNTILRSQNHTNIEQECSSKLELLTSVVGIGHSVAFAVINVLMSRLATRMRLMMVVLLSLSCLSSVGLIFTTNDAASMFLFLGGMTCGLGIGLVFSYFVNLYPTSYRGMAACLGVMVARACSLAATNVIGIYIMTHCHHCFYFFAAYIFSGIVLAFFLPPDGEKKI